MRGTQKLRFIIVTSNNNNSCMASILTACLALVAETAISAAVHVHIHTHVYDFPQEYAGTNYQLNFVV